MRVLVFLGALLGPVVEAGTKTILHFTDVHLNYSESGAQPPCAYYSDAPVTLLESGLEYAKSVAPDPDFFLYTGDHVVHGQFTDEYIAKALQENVKTLEKYYTSKDSFTTTAIIGNADTNPDYHMPVTDIHKDKENPALANVAGAWEDTLSTSDLEKLRRRGYLRTSFDEQLEILTLNTVPYSPWHSPDSTSDPDPFEQFVWLNKTLQELQDKSKFAYITGHIPPIIDSYGGSPQWHENYIVTYKTIVEQYTDVIKAQIFGHVHSVEFRMPVLPHQDADDTSGIVPLHVSGSISPLFGNNPSFMVWEVDSDTYEMLDYTVYATNISSSDQTLEWKRLYRASEAYGLKDLSTNELGKMYARMSMDAQLLDTYYWHMKADAYHLSPCTTYQCRAKILCTMKWWTTRGEFLACVDGARNVAQRMMLMDGTSLAASEPISASEIALVMLTALVASGGAVGCFVLVSRMTRRPVPEMTKFGELPSQVV